MAVLADTNVIADVLHGDPVWAGWSATQMMNHASELTINPIIFAELSYRAQSVQEVDQIVSEFGFRYEELPRPALFVAAKAFRDYRQRGGSKTSTLPDFFIGAHAEVAGHTILTRDHARYATYFPSVALIHP